MAKKVTTVSVEKDVIIDFKKFCIERGQTLSGRLEELMKNDMQNNKE